MSLAALMQAGLPLNRKERFYTGTVFPMIVCRDGFRYFDHFTALIDEYRWQPLNVTPESANIQFFTEYGLAESIVSAAAERFAESPQERDTPDILIFIRGEHTALIALEAKMYLAPAPTALRRQMLRQKSLLDFLQDSLAIDDVHHAALVPEQWRIVLQDFEFPIITWNDLYKQFEAVIPGDYFLEILRLALDNYGDLVSQQHTGGKNNQLKMTGLSIYEQFKDGTLSMRVMGRQSGLDGSSIQQDIESGAWRTQLYETSSESDPPNRNWFYIDDFIARLED